MEEILDTALSYLLQSFKKIKFWFGEFFFFRSYYVEDLWNMSGFCGIHKSTPKPLADEDFISQPIGIQVSSISNQ